MSEIDAINRANPNTISDHLRNMKWGSILAGRCPQLLQKKSMDAAGNNASQQATLDCFKLGSHMKAATIIRAVARAGAAGTGEMAVQAYGVTPASGQIAVAPNGDIVTLAADAITDLDVYYQPIELVRREVQISVIAGTGVGALPAGVLSRGVFYLESAIVTAGGVTGEKRVLVPGAVNPGTPSARLSIAKDAVNFTVADAVTMATVVVLELPQIHLISGQKFDLYDLLNGVETII